MRWISRPLPTPKPNGPRARRPFDAANSFEATEYESSGTISEADYIGWVQRSLNRLFRTTLPTDGRDSLAYRTAVRKFNRRYLGRAFKDIDEKAQNRIIVANQRDPNYQSWLIKALKRVGAGRISNRDVSAAVKSFQRSVGLNVDGFAGSKTELALIRASNLSPPGQVVFRHPELGPGISLPSLADPDLCRVATEMSCAMRPARSCFPDGRDARLPVADTTVAPHKWICEIVLVFRDPVSRAFWAFSAASGLLVGRSHVLTSAHVLHQKLGSGALSRVRSAVAAVFLFGFTSDSAGNKVFPYAPIIQKRSSAFRVSQEWKDHIRGANNEPQRFDYGLISLKGAAHCSPKFLGSSANFPSGFWGDKNSRSTVAPLVKKLRYGTFANGEVQLAGYPGDLACLQWTSSGPITGLEYGGRRGGKPHYKGTARHDAITHRIGTVAGMSGSPVWGRKTLKATDGVRREMKVLVGVQSRCGRSTAITPFVWEKHLEKWMTEI